MQALCSRHCCPSPAFSLHSSPASPLLLAAPRRDVSISSPQGLVECQLAATPSCVSSRASSLASTRGISAPRVACQASPQSTGAQTQTQSLEELNQDNFYRYLEAQGDALTVVDFYTDWCGPCQVMLPELYKLQDEMPNIRIVKFNCNKQNKDLGKALNIRVAPTFHLYRNSQKVGEMTGAKIDKLRSLIESALGDD
ncbi:thioredoxin-like protein [Dunaliella salina]|uniref:Thioredoxin-like protein n=1 Tax=Dunaliella salina TaxID=3046 RepID=A0ABQ7GI83_DUNSA|nr:thioredoxin-like protein [Dunaliella salina]|eukprot:KAF5834326.1 thioredoxin-like protein [Dunaliella salina]